MSFDTVYGLIEVVDRKKVRLVAFCVRVVDVHHASLRYYISCVAVWVGSQIVDIHWAESGKRLWEAQTSGSRL